MRADGQNNQRGNKALRYGWTYVITQQHTDRRQLRIHAFDCIEGDRGVKKQAVFSLQSRDTQLYLPAAPGQGHKVC